MNERGTSNLKIHRFSATGWNSLLHWKWPKLSFPSAGRVRVVRWESIFQSHPAAWGPPGSLVPQPGPKARPGGNRWLRECCLHWKVHLHTIQCFNLTYPGKEKQLPKIPDELRKKKIKTKKIKPRLLAKSNKIQLEDKITTWHILLTPY